MEYKSTLEYSVSYNGEEIKVTAKVLGYNELHDWVKKWKDKDQSDDIRSDDDILAKILSVDLTQDGEPIDVSKLKEMDLRLVKAINQGYLVASGITEKEQPPEKKASVSDSQGA